MKTITVFQADDGSRWDDAESAQKRDEMYLKAQCVEQSLGARPLLECDEYWQHFPNDVARSRALYDSLAMEYFGTTNGRVVSDSGNPIARLMTRLDCIDAAGREWNQPFYARHTPAKPRCVNEKVTA
jgi:hypothetical protein